MQTKQKIANWLAKCAAVYPDYATMDGAMLRAKVEVFDEMLSGLTAEQIDKAFRHHMTSRPKEFPTPAHIIDSLTPVKMYQFDNGPKGFGALYPPDHPYVSLQHRLGLERLEGYSVNVCTADGLNIAAMQSEARSLPSIPIDRTVEEIEDMEDRRGGGFKRISYATEEQWDELNDNLKGFAR